jgi:6-phosphogluconolactonase/glucosamine-6-phosphate isomerase/deaminase
MITEFKTKNDLENMLLKTIYNDILQIVSKSGEAKLLLSGGSTPTSLYLKLNQMFLNWEKVICGLTDERNVNTNDDASNEKLIRSTLLLNKPDSNFIGMKNNDLELHENLIYAELEKFLKSQKCTHIKQIVSLKDIAIIDKLKSKGFNQEFINLFKKV